MLGSSWVAAELAASQEGPSFLELCTLRSNALACLPLNVFSSKSGNVYTPGIPRRRYTVIRQSHVWKEMCVRIFLCQICLKYFSFPYRLSEMHAIEHVALHLKCSLLLSDPYLNVSTNFRSILSIMNARKSCSVCCILTDGQTPRIFPTFRYRGARKQLVECDITRVLYRVRCTQLQLSVCWDAGCYKLYIRRQT
jgi:hypothetical protein